MNYLPRTIQPVIEEASKFFKIVMVSGMRQVGKSTLLKQLSSDKRTIKVLTILTIWNRLKTRRSNSCSLILPLVSLTKFSVYRKFLKL